MIDAKNAAQGLFNRYSANIFEYINWNTIIIADKWDGST